MVPLKTNTNFSPMGVATTQWIRLRLPSFITGFEYQAHHLRLFHS